MAFVANRTRSIHGPTKGSQLKLETASPYSSKPLPISARPGRSFICAESSTKNDSMSCLVPLNIHGLKSRTCMPMSSKCDRARLTKEVFPEPQAPRTPTTRPSVTSSRRICSANERAILARPMTSSSGFWIGLSAGHPVRSSGRLVSVTRCRICDFICISCAVAQKPRLSSISALASHHFAIPS